MRGYKFTLLDYLKRREGRILKSSRNVIWHHIQGMVLFGQDIHFDEHLPPNIKSWFQICDHRTVARDLCSRLSSALRLEPVELTEILHCLELNDAHLYSGPQPTSPHAISTQSEPPAGKMRVVIHKESGFRESWLHTNQAGTLKSDGAVQIQTILDELRRGINALARFQSSADARVPGSTIYTINPRCQLLLFRVKNFIYPWFVGDPEEIDNWLAANEGFTLVVDGATQRITSTVVGKPLTEGNVEPPKPTTENLPFFARLPSLDLTALVAKSLVRKHLLDLTEESSETEIVEVLELIEDEGLRLFLFDVINLIRKNDLAGAEARIRLPQGDACPIEDAAALTEEAVESGANSDQILELKKKEELERVLDKDHFHEWMLYLHRDQTLIAEAQFDKPAILTGVSGSGKTCILVHRARHLARKYPGERIGVMTLNRALADLLKNLVQQLCSEEERRNIQVMAFYDYFKELLHDLGPESYLNQLRALSPESRSLRQVLRDVNPQNLANEVDILSGETSENTWDDFFDQNNDEVHSKLLDAMQPLEAYRIDASRYLREECTLVRSALTLVEREKYLDGTTFPREGRAIPFQPAMRKAMGNIVTLFEEWMLAGGVLDVVELTQAVTPLWPELRKLAPERRFRCLLVDEFQDLSTLDLRLLLHVPTSAENGLFLAGDTVQKILVKKLRLHDAALGKGNVTKHEIKKNYRNSRQILKAASKLANHYCPLKRGQFLLGFLRVGAMDDLRILAHRTLSVSLGVAAVGGALSPAIAVGMKRDALDAEALAALLELGGAIRLPDRDQVREERSGPWPALNDLPGFGADAHSAQGGGLLPVVNKGRALVIDVHGVQGSDVGLRAAQIPAEVVIVAALRIALPGNDERMLLPRDAALVLVLDFGKELLGQNAFGQPVQVDCVVLKPAQVNICADSAEPEHLKEICGLGLNQDAVHNQFQCRIF